MSALLVTGGAGFIGCNFVHYWMANHPDDCVVVLDALTYAGSRDNLSELSALENFHFVHGNILDTELVESLLRRYGIDILVNFAAESHVDRSISGPDAFIETNVLGTHSLLKAARSVWLEGAGREHRFHHVSTDEVYGSLESDDAPFAESHQYQPNSPYSASKAASDHLVRAYHHTYGLQVTTSNCSNNYGPYHYPEKLIPLAIARLLTGKTVSVYGDGENIRDWLFVEDHARAIDAVLQRGRLGEVYNIGGNMELSNLALLNILCEELDTLIEGSEAYRLKFPQSMVAQGRQSIGQLEFIVDRPGHDRRYAIDATKAMTEIGYKPRFDFQAGIRLTLKWYLERESWWLSRLDAGA